MSTRIASTFLLAVLSMFQYTAVAQSLSKADEAFVDMCVENLIQAERKTGGAVMGSMIQTWRDGDCMTELKNKKSSVVSSSPSNAKDSATTQSYRGVSGKFGIYEMTKMDITKNKDGKTYTVEFDGERAITYDDATLVNGKIELDDKGFVAHIVFNGNKAVIEDPIFPKNEWPVFERTKK
jgi:hypothetical protein